MINPAGGRAMVFQQASHDKTDGADARLARVALPAECSNHDQVSAVSGRKLDRCRRIRYGFGTSPSRVPYIHEPKTGDCMSRMMLVVAGALLMAGAAQAQTPGPGTDVERTERTRPVPPPVTDVQPIRPRPAPTRPGSVQAAPLPKDVTLTPGALSSPIAVMRIQRPAWVSMTPHKGADVPAAYFSGHNPAEYDIWISVDAPHRREFVNVEMSGLPHTVDVPCFQLPAKHAPGVTGFSSHYPATVNKMPDGTWRMTTTAPTENGKGTVQIRRCNQDEAKNNYTLLTVRIY